MALVHLDSEPSPSLAPDHKRRGGTGDGGRTIDGAVTCLDAIDRDRRPFAKPATGQENDGPAAGRALGWNHRTEGWGWDDKRTRASCRKLAVWIR